MPACGKVWFDREAMTNALGLSEIVKKHRVTFDSAKESAFTLHDSDASQVKFRCNEEGLCVH